MLDHLPLNVYTSDFVYSNHSYQQNVLGHLSLLHHLLINIVQILSHPGYLRDKPVFMML